MVLEHNFHNNKKIYDYCKKMKPTPKEMQAIHEKYDVVVKHLIEEGYAEDKESADKIISGMSEMWFNMIID